MLQRAASNAYSWCWASNIRTKQSKWLDGNLQEMEEKMKTMNKLIEVDADSFAKKAEMYYQRRPELKKFLEETHKSYKALADRYDRLSGELHKANHALASAFPDQIQFAMQDDEEDGFPRAFTGIDNSKFRKAVPPGEAPPINFRNKNRDTLAALKKHHKKITSHIAKENAQNEIDRLQKEILVLQTEKEFVKTSYERSLAKLLDIETQITDLQDEVCSLQDESIASSIIEDNDARALMAAAAIKSCEESLLSLRRQQKKSGEEAEIECKRIREVKNRLKLLKGEKCSPSPEPELEETFDREISNEEEEGFRLKIKGLDLYSVCAQAKKHFEMNSDTSVVDLVEKIDELVEKVSTLEVTISSQTAQICTVRSETDKLQKHLQSLEEDKANSIIDTNSLNVRLRQAEDELYGVQDLEKIMRHDKGIFQTHFLDACICLNDISEKLQSPSLKEKNKGVKEDVRGERGDANGEEDEVQSDYNEASSKFVHNSAMVSSLLKDLEPGDKNFISDLQKLLNNGPEGRQKLLQNYKDAKKKQTETEKNQERHFEMMAQIQELKSVNAVKEQEIRDLKMKLFHHTSSKGATMPACPDEIVEIEEEMKVCHFDQQQSTSTEEKFRAEIDTILDENLNFWLRFSTSYHQVQKFDASFKELEAGMNELKDLLPRKGGSAPPSPKLPSKRDAPPLDKKLRELHTDLQVWLEQNDLLKGELQGRFTSLCIIQEEISKVSRDAEVADSSFTPYQAAKFQGEVLNMQQENNKVTMELQTGVDHVKALQSQVAMALSKLRESFDLSVSNGYQQYQNFRHCSTRSKIPLRTFLFGEKRRKPSLFSCISPALHRSHSQVKSGFLS